MSEKKNTKKVKKNILIKKVVKLVPVLVSCVILCYMSFDLFVTQNIKTNLQINNIKNEINQIQSKTKEIDRKASLIKNFINTWENEISEAQKTADGINIESIKKIFSDIGKKYMINNIDASFSMPIPVDNGESAASEMLNTEIVINFSCLTEYSIYYFIDELYKGRYASFIIEELNIKKIRNIDKGLIKLLVDEGNASTLSVTMKLQWYERSNKQL